MSPHLCIYGSFLCSHFFFFLVNVFPQPECYQYQYNILEARNKYSAQSHRKGIALGEPSESCVTLQHMRFLTQSALLCNNCCAFF